MNNISRNLFISVFCAVLFVSSSLLFVIQPIIGKIVTAKFGGGAQVWCLILFFFQFILFIGYSFSYFLTKQKVNVQIFIYAVIICLLFYFSNIPSGNEWAPKSFENPILDLLMLFVYYLGVPCFVLGTVSTLMQKWYYHLQWGEPYYLYSISNIGSMLCLLAYPFIIEPFFSIQDSLKYWSFLLVLDGALLLVCCFVFFKQSKLQIDIVKNNSKLKKSQCFEWVVFSALGTMLLVSVTQFMTSDIAPIPLLWIAPLLIYLLSFVLNFNSSPLYNKSTRSFYIVFGQILVFMIVFNKVSSIEDLAFYFFALFFSCMVIHGELYSRRPDAYFLPTFYLLISFGGMLGSLFVNFLFPAVFNINIDSTLILSLFIVLCFYILKKNKVRIFFLESMDKSYRFLSISLCLGLILNLFFARASIFDKRNFYGSISLERDVRNDSSVLRLVNGIIVHGFQLESDDKRRVPTSYYNLNSPFSAAIDTIRLANSDQSLNLGVVGLGVGTVATYLNENDTGTFYEIDPKITQIAKEHFSFLKDSLGKFEIYTGDGRLLLDRQDAQSFDLLLIDAFNSDAIPTHLLTVEAFKVYLKHLKNDGLLVFHVSNRFLKLSKICELNAKSLALKSLTLHSKAINSFQTDTLYCLISRSDEKLETLRSLIGLNQYKNIKMIDNETSGISAWSDSFSNIYSILKF